MSEDLIRQLREWPHGTSTALKAADEIERLRAIAIERMELFKQAATDAERLSLALQPFAACVFNDNGDVTLTTSNLRIEDYMRAKSALIAH